MNTKKRYRIVFGHFFEQKNIDVAKNEKKQKNTKKVLTNDKTSIIITFVARPIYKSAGK